MTRTLAQVDIVLFVLLFTGMLLVGLAMDSWGERLLSLVIVDGILACVLCVVVLLLLAFG